MLASKQLILVPVRVTGEIAKVSQPAAGSESPKDRRRLIFAIVSIGLFMASVDQTIVATALPAIERELHAAINWSGWTISIYALGQVIAMPMAGKISDMYGRKKVFMISAAVFTLSSLCCGLAPDIELLSFTPEGPLLCVRPYTNNSSYWQVYFDTNRTIVETFREAGYPTPETPSIIRRVS